MRLTTLSVMIFCQIWFGGCAGSSSSSADSASEWRRTVTSSKSLFREVTKEGNAVPDAILNLTKCVVVLAGDEKRQGVRQGVAACREAHDKWVAPTAVTLSRISNRASLPSDDLFLFVIGDPAVRALRSNALQVSERNAAPGPTVGAAATVTDAEIKRDLLTYRQRRGRLEGVSVAGVLRRVGDLPRESDERALLEAMTSYFNSITPIGIIIHHSSTLETQHVPSGVREVDRFHARKAFEILCEGKRYHVAYHYLVLPNGRIQAGRPEHCQGAHAEGYNSYLGISLVGDFSSRNNRRGERGNTRPTKKQLAAMVTLCRQLAGRYHIPLHRIVRHSDVARTECPGDRFPYRQLLADLD